jgi:hypothetical protein
MMPRLLGHADPVIFIVYSVSHDAEQQGYSDWLQRIDNPFFNNIPGIHYYANWRVSSVAKGGPLAWDYFDFQGLTSKDMLESVWFNQDLDGFRKEWLRLWGYGRPESLPVFEHAYVMRRVGGTGAMAGSSLRLQGGTGPAPDGEDADVMFRTEGILHKHFLGGGVGAAWLTPTQGGNPLGLDWLSVSYDPGAPGLPEATVVVDATLIAEPSKDWRKE